MRIEDVDPDLEEFEDSDIGQALLRAAPQQAPTGGNSVAEQIIEPVTGWWSGNAQFGQRRTGDLPASLAGVQPIPLLELPRAPGPPRPIGVQLYRSDKQVATLANSDVQCEVTYGAGGTSNTFKCDWSAGAGFTLIANTVRLSIVPFLPHGLNPYSALTGLILGATVGIGALPRNNVVFTAKRTAQYINNTSAQAAIPDFATGFHLTSVALGALPVNLANVQIEFRSSDNTTIDCYTADSVKEALASEEGLRIPGMAQFVSVENKTGADIFMGLQFVLGL